jgi:3,4-dihydroxy 2-butanone 4-phosphate synthase/GTP cyclohydrolase II
MSNTALGNEHAAPSPTFTDDIARQDAVECHELRGWRGVAGEKERGSVVSPERFAAARLRTSLDGSSGLGLVKPKTVEQVARACLPTEFGDFQIVGYRSVTSDEEFVVLTMGELQSNVPTPVRIHSQCMTGEVFGSLKCDCGRQLRHAMELIQTEGRGAIIYQQQEGRGIGIMNKIRAYALQDKGADTIEANLRLGLEVDQRCYAQCAEIFLDLGLRQVRVMSNSPHKIRVLEKCGLEIVERIPLETPPTAAALRYLRTKKEKMGHLLEAV